MTTRIKETPIPSPTARQQSVDLQQAADELGVHYQTAYKWVRSGRLPASRVKGRYVLDRSVVEEFALERLRPADLPVRAPRGGYDKLVERSFEQLLVGDEKGLRTLVHGLLYNGVSLTTVISEVLVPSLVEVGQQWASGRLDVATEHRCSAIVERVIAEHMPSPRGRRRGTAVVAAPEGDMHSLPAAMAAAALREDNWKVEHLGANMPSGEITEFCKRESPDLVVLTATAPEARKVADRAAAAITTSGTPVLVGGAGQSLEDLTFEARKSRQP